MFTSDHSVLFLKAVPDGSYVEVVALEDDGAPTVPQPQIVNYVGVGKNACSNLPSVDKYLYRLYISIIVSGIDIFISNDNQFPTTGQHNLPTDYLLPRLCQPTVWRKVFLKHHIDHTI